MDAIDKLYLRDEKRIIKFFATQMLSELIELNIECCNNEYHNTTGEDVYNIMINSLNFSAKEKQDIIQSAIYLVNLRYNKSVVDFENLSFKQIN